MTVENVSKYNLTYHNTANAWQNNFSNYSKYWYNMTVYNISIYNETYDQWAYNMTVYNASVFNETYDSLVNNESYLTTYNETYATTYVNKSGGSFTGDINMTNHNITNVRAIVFNNQSGGGTAQYLTLSAVTTLATGSSFTAATITGTTVISSGDLYTNGAGDDLWLGTATYGAAAFRAHSSGEVQARNITLNYSSIIIKSRANATLSYWNETGDMNLSRLYADRIAVQVGNVDSAYINNTGDINVSQAFVDGIKVSTWLYNMSISNESIYNLTYHETSNAWQNNFSNYSKYWYNMTLYNVSIYNSTYAGLINNVSYLSTYNVTYATTLLNLSGGIMSGNIQMGGNNVTNVSYITYKNSTGAAGWRTYVNATNALITEYVP